MTTPRVTDGEIQDAIEKAQHHAPEYGNLWDVVDVLERILAERQAEKSEAVAGLWVAESDEYCNHGYSDRPALKHLPSGNYLLYTQPPKQREAVTDETLKRKLDNILNDTIDHLIDLYWESLTDVQNEDNDRKGMRAVVESILSSLQEPKK